MGIKLARSGSYGHVPRPRVGLRFARKRLLGTVVMVLLAGLLGIALGGCVYYPAGSGYYAGPAYGHAYGHYGHGDDDDD